MQIQNAIPIEDTGKERDIICGQTTLSKNITLNHVITLAFFHPSILKFNSLSLIHETLSKISKLMIHESFHFHMGTLTQRN